MKLTPLITTRFRSDGGAMFGLVPKTIWSQLVECDDRNLELPLFGDAYLSK
ncbi:MAG: hypothetical protein KJ626_04510 [Verrucomicrobia bacterium]|nr:hypothetical protein [Verrucomicrobiota bacterium]